MKKSTGCPFDNSKISSEMAEGAHSFIRSLHMHLHMQFSRYLNYSFSPDGPCKSSPGLTGTPKFGEPSAFQLTF